MPGNDYFTPNPLDPREPRVPLERPFRRGWERPFVRELRWGPAKIRILIVSDGSSYDENASFGLGIALADAFDPAHPDHPDYARFEITKAHRGTTSGATPGFEDFEFSEGSLEEFDEVWLFGVSTSAPYLGAAEVKVLEDFMDAGGGVLAMGDHEDLGLGLCGGVKRVRSMRKWWFQNPAPPAGMAVAPDSTDLTRNDTVHAATPGGDVNLGSQGDDRPQTIYPNYRYRWPHWRPFGLAKYPHPVLCGPRGVITVMPDHAHEGDCIVPDPSFAEEYPGNEAVEVVARGRNVVGRTKGGYTITEPREFGLIGAWDGHESGADAGRVLVDATWHHWFNINLFGLRAENGTEYADILAYYRNCAVWLAPPAQQHRMRRAGTLISLLIPSLVEHTITWKKLEPERFYRIGTYAKDALGRVAPQCQSAAWFQATIERYLPGGLKRALDPERLEKLPPDDIRRRALALGAEHVTTAVFGGAMNAVAAQIHERGFGKLDGLHDDIDDLAARGAKVALEQTGRSLERACEQLSALAR
ncbi:MAG TPA: hypothetical protein RMH99_14555 [Sandaracinaceae bacterium LLY-WYZ-13_1]|nr:hypothetical protein [Sandaracinaceae bacterium LLY-WYZ-13_1]